MGRHTGVKPFRCELCGKEFISTITFKRHAIVHSGMVKLFWRLLTAFRNKKKIASALYNLTHITYCLCSYRKLSFAFLFQGRSRLSAMSVEGVLLGLLISKFTCQCTVKINHTSVESVRRCSLALAHWRNTSELTQVCQSPLFYMSSFPPFLPLVFLSFSSFPPLLFLVTLHRGKNLYSKLLNSVHDKLVVTQSSLIK